MANLIDVPAGLEGVVVAETAVGDVRGDEGYYHYRGYPAQELARHTSLEEVWHLLHYGSLPDEGQLSRFRGRTAPLRVLPASVLTALPTIAASGTPMAALRTAVSLAAQESRPWMDLVPDDRQTEALRVAAMMPALVAAVWRTRNGDRPVASDARMNVAADYLQMITGSAPSALAVQAVERYLVLTIDHGFNASTFAARVVASTGADLGACAVAGLAALSGPLHGGAPSRVVEMLRDIGSATRAREWIAEALGSGRRIMGFGHRVYRTEDPRSAVLKETALQLGGPLVELAVEVERVVLETLETRYPERQLRTNVEYYAGVVLHEVGLPAALFSPTFAVSRMMGWMAQVLEQTERNRIIRPASRYVGPLHVWPAGAAVAESGR